MRRVYLVRHGWRIDSEDSAWRLTAELPDDPPLAARGLQQARETGAYLRRKPVAALYCSPFLRCIQTAQCIAEATGLCFRVEPALSEWLNPDWFAGMPKLSAPEEIRRAYGSYDPSYVSDAVVRYPEPEAEVHMLARIRPFLARLEREEAGEVILVGHGASVALAAHALLGSADGIAPKLCSVTELEKRDGRWTCLGSTVQHLSFVAEA